MQQNLKAEISKAFTFHKVKKKIKNIPALTIRVTVKQSAYNMFLNQFIVTNEALLIKDR